MKINNTNLTSMQGPVWGPVTVLVGENSVLYM